MSLSCFIIGFPSYFVNFVSMAMGMRLSVCVCLNVVCVCWVGVRPNMATDLVSSAEDMHASACCHGGAWRFLG